MIAKLFRATCSGSLLFSLTSGAACSSPARAPADSAIASPREPALANEQPARSPLIAELAAAQHQGPAAQDQGPSVSEVEARLLLDRLFRDAGLRIANDRQVRRENLEVTLDGYDPERGIGYEYIAAEERGTDVSGGEAALLRAEAKILVLEGGSLDDLEALATAFLAGISDGNPEPWKAPIDFK